MSFAGFCPNCGEPRPVGAQFCGKCGVSFVPVVQQDQAETGINVFMWIASILSLGGLVWLWLNTSGDNLFYKVVIVGFLEAIWIGVVFAVMGFVALLLGMAGFVVRPWRK